MKDWHDEEERQQMREAMKQRHYEAIQLKAAQLHDTYNAGKSVESYSRKDKQYNESFKLYKTKGMDNSCSFLPSQNSYFMKRQDSTYNSFKIRKSDQENLHEKSNREIQKPEENE